MQDNSLKNIFTKFIFPSLLILILFIILIFYIVLPFYQDKMIEDRKIMIKELTLVAVSLLEEIYQEQQRGLLTREEAQAQAVRRISSLRYGEDNKDYFWINDYQPVMIVHPYRPELVGQDLSTFEDSHGERMFMTFVRIVKANGEGFAYYMWQWKDDAAHIVPKLSFVKSFEPWQWIIGTGIYIEDVRERIFSITQHVLLIIIFITVLIAGILFYNIRLSLKGEQLRKRAEEALLQAKAKYKALVDASQDGLLMITGDKLLYASHSITELTGYERHELVQQPLTSLLSDYEKIKTLAEQDIYHRIETKLQTKNERTITVLVAFSPFKMNDLQGLILIIRELHSGHTQPGTIHEENKDDLIHDLLLAQFFLYQPLTQLIMHELHCSSTAPALKAIQLMNRHNFGAVLVTQQDNECVGICTDRDLRERLLAGKKDLNSPLYSIMTAPLISLSATALVSEALHVMQEKQISYLAVKDEQERVKGLIYIKELFRNQAFSLTQLLRQIERAHSLYELAEVHRKLPLLVKVLLNNGTRARNVLRLLTNCADKMFVKVIELTVNKYGNPPADFAFVAYGSLSREEQTLFSDQDNGLIFAGEGVADDAAARDFFLTLGQEICANLNEIGYTYCPGNSMASNPELNLSLAAWQKKINTWIMSSGPQDLLGINTFFDFRLLYGQGRLAEELAAYIRQTIAETPAFLTYLAHNALESGVPFDIFGNLALTHSSEHQADCIDIKAVLLPLINTARVLAMRFHIRESNTLQRLNRLYELGELVPADYKDLEEAYNFLMGLRLKAQLSVDDPSAPDTHYLIPQQLTSWEKAALKKAAAQISLFHARLKYYFSGRV